MQTISRCSINSWGPVWFLLSVLFFAGCSNEDDTIGNETEGTAIAFDCSAAPSARVAETTTENMQYFRVSAEWNKDGSNYATFMSNQLVEKLSGSWVYSPTKYWPGYGTVSFFAYSPATSSGMNPESFGIDKTTNTVTINYEVKEKYQEQEDFMVATNLDTQTSPIRLNFKHALSTATFKVCGYDTDAEGKLIPFRVIKIELNNLYSKGTLVGTPGQETAAGKTSTWKWDDSKASGLTTYTVYQKHPVETPTDGTYIEIGDIVVLPQQIDVNFSINITYNTGEGTSDDTVVFTPDSDLIFEMGRKYTFYLDINRQHPSTRALSPGTSIECIEVL